MVHVVATGWCRGEYRTVEAVLMHPPFPYGLAASGRLYSADPLVVKGTSSASAYSAGQADRPGHVVSNSPAGIRVDRPADTPAEMVSYISGFVKSAGPVSIAPPATVRMGVRAEATETELPRVLIEDFRNASDSGVIHITEDQFGSQVLDVMYFYQGAQPLVYNGAVEMKDSFLFVDGDLVIFGGVKGRGAIVATGGVRIEGGVSLDGANHVAVLAGKDIVLRGGGNHFQGILYCEGNLQAENVTVVGNTILNSPTPAGGNANLRNVTIVTNESAGRLSFTAVSNTAARGQNAFGRTPVTVQFAHGLAYPQPRSSGTGPPADPQKKDLIMVQSNDLFEWAQDPDSPVTQLRLNTTGAVDEAMEGAGYYEGYVPADVRALFDSYLAYGTKAMEYKT
jgi:hypothetical protein